MLQRNIFKNDVVKIFSVKYKYSLAFNRKLSQSMSNITAMFAMEYRRWPINTVTKFVKCNHTNNV